ncbi:hydrogen peroxide-inducible genes activator [Aurantimonas sp. C2-6-R+9]|uniref:hydrogen peroxide-inducible genes activator n=1 Tax=unclassified Aurantimonas TaxID=2638230 RepID=UPI002E186DBD|nr:MULTISPECIES: hydrogen peroxide-inducible genes activator [unclassified Aurantimonas]MEC5292306.1 hydrogen peroxide-inducible genes activator [Aurantimonas sp. C2-3-R2]MEC5382589.1 hydrogen peroxide-inducible genes activator [Aurantimonas sp. C2-6-R+9]MEC5413391.1 hydrogen peroxide-inducible genes activator [Aurantimonas sp. C2-4-R8]
MITIRQLRYFHALSETLHFGRAAKQLNISQPALSAQIAQMEAFFGGPLFNRAASGVSLTSDGTLVRERAARILAEVGELESLATLGDRLLSRRLRLGIIASVAPYLLPAVLRELGCAYPTLECEIRESVTDRLLADLTAGRIDCALVALPIEDPGIETIALFDDPFHLALPAAEAGRLPVPVPIAALRQERLILLEEGHCLRAQALEICRIADAGEMAGLAATSLATILRMVSGGLGATLIPQMAIADETRHGGIAVLPFQAPTPFRTIALAFRPSTARRRDFDALADLIRLTGSAVPTDASVSDRHDDRKKSRKSRVAVTGQHRDSSGSRG